MTLAFPRYMRAEEAAVSGQPVEHDGVEHLVAGQRVFWVAPIVGPGMEFLVDPGRLPYWRIREPITQRLRACRLVMEVAEAIAQEMRR